MTLGKNMAYKVRITDSAKAELEEIVACSSNESDCNLPLLSLQQWIPDSCRSDSVAATHVF